MLLNPGIKLSIVDHSVFDVVGGEGVKFVTPLQP